MNLSGVFQKVYSGFSKGLSSIQVPHAGEIYYRRVQQDIAKRLVELEADKDRFVAKYGVDFYAFLYQPGLDSILRNEVLDFRSPQWAPNKYLDNNHWNTRHPLNFPGPFYTGESDTCGTGVVNAPANVLNDARWNLEYIFRQPANYTELLCVLDAAGIEVLDSYSGNGNENWTYTLCREWWRNKYDILNYLDYTEGGKLHIDKMYYDYLQGEAEIDLRRYCYFLEHGYYPYKEKIFLPDL